MSTTQDHAPLPVKGGNVSPTDEAMTDAEFTAAFLKDVCPRVRDLPRLLKSMKEKWPDRKWPQQDVAKTNLAYRCIDTILDILGHGKGAEVLEGYAFSKGRGHMRSALGQTKYDTLLDRIKIMLESCKNKDRTDPVRNSVDSDEF